MTPTHELVVLQSKQRIRRVKELGMENNFDAVIYTVEQIAATNPVERERERERKI